MGTEFIHLVIPRVVSPGTHRVTAVVIHRKSEKKKVPGAVDNWPDGGIECNVLFTIDGKGGDLSEELWTNCRPSNSTCGSGRYR